MMGVMKRSEKMTVSTLPELDFLTPMKHAATEAKPCEVQADCLQEQFTGRIPVRSERPMAKILAERLAEADPASTGPLFIP